MRTLLCLLFIAAASTLALAAQAPTLKADHLPEMEKQALQVEKDWNEAVKSQNRAKIERFCAADFVLTDDEGKLSDLPKYLDATVHHLKINSYTLSELAAKLYGDTAVVTGHWKGTVTVDGEDSEGLYGFTDTFVRRDGRWWAIASQMSAIPAK